MCGSTFLYVLIVARKKVGGEKIEWMNEAKERIDVDDDDDG